jgi:proline iminopeptidase
MGGHELYYEICGNPTGIPILFIHGGAGAGFSERDYFTTGVHPSCFFELK